MALREVEAHYRFRGGIETLEDPKAVPATQLSALENGVFARRSAIRKRNGYEALSTVVDGAIVDRDPAIRMGARGNELLEFTTNRCYSRQTGADQLSDAGPVYSALASERPLVKTGTQQTQPDQASLDGVTVTAWEDSSGGVWWSTIDTVSGRVYRAATQADALGRSPRCVAVGPNLHVYYAVPSTHMIMALVIIPASPSAAVAPVTVVADLDATNPIYDACSTTRFGSPAAIAWFEHSTTAVKFGYVDQSGAIGSPAAGHPAVYTHAGAPRNAASPLALAFYDVDGADADRFAATWWANTTDGFIGFFAGGDVDSAALIRLLDGSNAYTVATALRAAIEVVIAGALQTAYVLSEESAAATSNHFVKATSFEWTALTTVALGTLRSVGLASRAFRIGSDVFATLVHDTTYFNTYVTMRYSGSDGFVPVGRHAPASAAGAPARAHLPSAHVDDDMVSIALPVRDRLVSENNDKFRETEIRLVSLDFDSEDSHQAVKLGAGLYMAGACPMHYDGRIWTEQGFHFGPELIATVTAAGGSMTASTTYLYRAWYEWPDAQGEVHRGPVSAGTLVTMAGGETQVTLTLPTLRVTRKTGVRIMVARSLAAKTGKTAQLFRVTSLDPTTAGSANGYVANDTTVDTVSFLDRMSDTNLELQDELYTDGGILSNDPCALGSVIAGGKNRIFMTDSSDGNTIRFSQELDAGYGVEFAPELQVAIDPAGGDITALAARDDRVFVFKANAIWTFSGDGPPPNGDASTVGFGKPQLLPGDVGCTDPASIALLPQGLVFKSAKGIYLLRNDGALEYVGAPAAAYNAQAVRRTLVMPDRPQALFLTDSGLSLLYDYLFGQWSTFTNHEGLDAAVVSNTYHYLRTDGRVFRETVGSYSDAGSRIRLRFETAPMHLQEQLQGFQKLFEMFLLGTWISPHQLGISYRTDYSDQWTSPYWLDATNATDSTGWITGDSAAEIGIDPLTGTTYSEGAFGDGPFGGTPSDTYEWRLDVYEPGHTVQFAFEDFEASGSYGASFELTEMLITGGVARNAIKPASSARSA